MFKISVRKTSRATQWSGDHYSVQAVDDNGKGIFGYEVTVVAPQRGWNNVMEPASINWSAIGSVSVAEGNRHIAVMKRAVALANRLNKKAGL